VRGVRLSAGNLLTLRRWSFSANSTRLRSAMLVGLSWAISQFTYAFGPGLLGVVRDVTGGYAAALGICVALELGADALILLRPATR